MPHCSFCDSWSFCDSCHGDRLFEQPPCAEGHGDDCPERVCTDCGDATLLGPVAPAGRIAVPATLAA